MNRKLIRAWGFTVCGSLLLTMGFSSKIAAQIELMPGTEGPTAYDYGGTWIVYQSGTLVTMEIQQNGREITGKASYDAGRKGIARGTVQGQAFSWTGQLGWLGSRKLDLFRVEITWHDGIGVYQADNRKAEGNGQLIGDTWPKGNPAGKVRWWTGDVFRKLPPAPKPIKRTGRMPAAQPAAEPLKPPFITASPPIKITFVPGASVYLGWDGGPDYPNADVWVSINNAPEISAALLYGDAFKQPKIGGFELRLQGGLYKYFLKAAGTTLATVTVAVP